MKAIVLFLALASSALADEYTPNNQFQLIKDEEGNFGIRIAGFINNYGCLSAGSISINNFVFSVSSSKWQRRADENDSWADVPGTTKEGSICGLSNPTVPGEYRWVADIGWMVASWNTLVVAGDPEAEEEESQETDETAVEAVTWGFLKSRATH